MLMLAKFLLLFLLGLLVLAPGAAVIYSSRKEREEDEKFLERIKKLSSNDCSSA